MERGTFTYSLDQRAEWALFRATRYEASFDLSNAKPKSLNGGCWYAKIRTRDVSWDVTLRVAIQRIREALSRMEADGVHDPSIHFRYAGYLGSGSQLVIYARGIRVNRSFRETFEKAQSNLCPLREDMYPFEGNWFGGGYDRIRVSLDEFEHKYCRKARAARTIQVAWSRYKKLCALAAEYAPGGKGYSEAKSHFESLQA